MPDTVPEQTVQTKLGFIAARARSNPQEQFNNLLHLLNAEMLAGSFHELKRKGASGVDGISWKEYGDGLRERVAKLVKEIHARSYRPQPARRVYIPKEDGSVRGLGIPSTEDKMVERSIVKILEAIYEEDFQDCSYGFRRGRSCHDALKAIDQTIMHNRTTHVVEADIRGFFDNVSHEWMLKFLGHRISDRRMVWLIARFLKAGYMESGTIHESGRGTPQGGNLSPMLANIFLHYVLDLWFEKKVKRMVTSAIYLVRYADDFVIMTEQEDVAQRIVEMLRERFKEFGLELHPDKTRVLSFGHDETERANKENRKPNTFDFLGMTHFCGKTRGGKFMVGHMTSGKRFRRSCARLREYLRESRNIPVKEWWQTLCAKVRGHYQYYGISGNMEALKRFGRIVEMQLLKWLNRRSQKKSFTMESFYEYLRKYPLPQPRIAFRLY
jgi:group II intron reverse transcriptase/maturase